MATNGMKRDVALGFMQAVKDRLDASRRITELERWLLENLRKNESIDIGFDRIYEMNGEIVVSWGANEKRKDGKSDEV